MAKQKKLELIVVDTFKLFNFANTHPPGFSSDDLVKCFIHEHQQYQMEKKGIPNSRGIILRGRKSKGYFYNIKYQIAEQEPKDIRLPKSGFYSEDVLIYKLPQGLQKIHDDIEKNGQIDLVLACELSDAETVKQTFTELEYDVHPWNLPS